MAAVDADRVMRDVGRRVADVRAHRGQTQERFAELLGVSLKYVQRIEAGRANLTIRSLTALAAALRVNPMELFRRPKNRVVRRGRPPKTR